MIFFCHVVNAARAWPIHRVPVDVAAPVLSAGVVVERPRCARIGAHVLVVERLEALADVGAVHACERPIGWLLRQGGALVLSKLHGRRVENVDPSLLTAHDEGVPGKQCGPAGAKIGVPRLFGRAVVIPQERRVLRSEVPGELKAGPLRNRLKSNDAVTLWGTSSRS